MAYGWKVGGAVGVGGGVVVNPIQVVEGDTGRDVPGDDQKQQCSEEMGGALRESSRVVSPTPSCRCPRAAASHVVRGTDTARVSVH